ncbi:hypothetical protein BD309DRAFT_946240 [Dichomitus squalens]|nr:hypothetical protein BD309DRAFT_946240 [Dichomitus squalens]
MRRLLPARHTAYSAFALHAARSHSVPRPAQADMGVRRALPLDRDSATSGRAFSLACEPAPGPPSGKLTYGCRRTYVRYSESKPSSHHAFENGVFKLKPRK